LRLQVCVRMPMSTNDLHPSLNRLAAFDRGELCSGEWQMLADHVAVCPACCAALEELPASPLEDFLRKCVRASRPLPVFCSPRSAEPPRAL